MASPAKVGSWPIATSMTVDRAKYQLPAGRLPKCRKVNLSKQKAAPAAESAATGHSPRYPATRRVNQAVIERVRPAVPTRVPDGERPVGGLAGSVDLCRPVGPPPAAEAANPAGQQGQEHWTSWSPPARAPPRRAIWPRSGRFPRTCQGPSIAATVRSRALPLGAGRQAHGPLRQPGAARGRSAHRSCAGRRAR